MSWAVWRKKEAEATHYLQCFQKRFYYPFYCLSSLSTAVAVVWHFAGVVKEIAEHKSALRIASQNVNVELVAFLVAAIIWAVKVQA